MGVTSSKEMWDMVYLIACGLHSCVPEEKRLAQMDLAGSIYQTAKRHSLVALVAMTIEKTEAFAVLEPAIQKNWQEAKNKAIRKNMLLNAEREKLGAFMASEGIWYAPLKGVILQEFYPRFGMRQMADNDILFDESKASKICDYLRQNGYEVVVFNRGVHDTYHKKPIYNFEMHRTLFHPSHSREWSSYYKDVKSRLVVKPGTEWEYQFTPEDGYVYIMAHACKHYTKSGGTGLRTLADEYCYLKVHGEEMDWNYIQKEAEILGIAEFERDIRDLAKKLLGESSYPEPDRFSAKERQMLYYMCNSGTHGTMNNRVGNELDKWKAQGQSTGAARIRYILNRIHPKQEWWEANYPFCARHRWAKPFCTVYRLLRGVTVRRRKMKSEIRALSEYQYHFPDNF